MLAKKIESALNTQIREEFFSSYLYTSIYLYFKRLNLDGFANWTLVQAREENKHAFIIIDYVNDRGGIIHLEALEKPENEWTSPLHAFEDAYRHECAVTHHINALVTLAHASGDHATSNMLQWFVKEQVEEERSTQEIVITLRDYIKDSKTGLLFLDKKLSKRTSD